MLHRKVMTNQRSIEETGIQEFLRLQRERISFLETALAQYNDGRSKNLYCIAAALLSAESLRQSLALAEDSQSLRRALNSYAEAEGQELKLRK